MTMTMTMIMIFLLSAIRARLHGCIDIGRQNEKDRLLDQATNLFRLEPWDLRPTSKGFDVGIYRKHKISAVILEFMLLISEQLV